MMRRSAAHFWARTDTVVVVPSAVRELVALVHDVLEARTDLSRVEAALSRIFETLPDLEVNPDLRSELNAFVDELIGDHVIADRLPLRARALGQIAWRTTRVANPLRATFVGALVAFLLESLDAEDEALEFIQLVEVEARRVNDPLLRAVAALRIRYLAHLQRFEDAHRIAREYEESLTPAPAADLIELHMLIDGTTAAVAEGDMDVALNRTRRAVDLFEMGPKSESDQHLVGQVFGRIEAARVYAARGEALRRSHDHLGAIDAFQQGRTKSLQAGSRLGAAWCLSEIAITWEHLAEFERAKHLLQQAAWEAEQAGDVRAAARWRGLHVPGQDGTVDMKGVNGLSAIHHMLQTQGPSEELERLTKHVIRTERGTGTTIEPMARSLLAAISAAIAVADKRQHQWLALSFRCHHVHILFKMGLWVSANEICDSIFNDVDRLLGEARASEIRQAAVAAVSSATEIALVTASADTEDQAGATRPRDPQRVLSIIDRSHGRTLNRWLGLRDWSRTTDSSDVVSATRELIAADVVVEWTAFAARDVSPVLEKRKTAAENLARVASSAGVTVPQSPGEGASSDLLTDLPLGMTILALTAIESGIVCLSLETGKSPRTEHLFWDRKSRIAWLKRLRAAQAEESLLVGVTPADPVSETQRVDDLKTLYDELRIAFTDPLVTWLGRDLGHLVVTMHAELASIPIWALVRTLPAVKLSVVPTLRSVALLAGRPVSNGQRNIAIGDGTHSLRMAPREVELLPNYTGIAAVVEDLQLATARVRRIHFAGHGEFDPDNPYSSGLILRGVNRSPYAIASSYAGCVRLTIPGILQRLELADCELITLSACSVGTPRMHAASEFTSVPTAFLLAGARNVLAASWPVHDAATTVLMSHFYAVLESGGNVATALWDARRKLSLTTREEASAILGRDDTIPAGDLPFMSPIFTDAFLHYGIE